MKHFKKSILKYIDSDEVYSTKESNILLETKMFFFSFHRYIVNIKNCLSN